MKVKRRTSLEIELLEVVEHHKKSGYPIKYIAKEFEKVLNEIKDPQPELKGEYDT